MFTFFEVGGKVRDELLGLKSKDIDYVAVLDEQLLKTGWNMSFIFSALEEYLIGNGYKIFLSTPDCLTIRARFPEDHANAGITADFVLARREVEYIEGTRTPVVEPGSLYDDLMRRDFTVNTIAKGPDGVLIDPFNGKRDLKQRILRTPIDAHITFNDDPLRLLRAIRFHITKGLKMSRNIMSIIETFDYKRKMIVVSEERIREELFKCFKYDSYYTMQVLNNYPDLARYVLRDTKLWLKPTNEQ